MKKFFVTVIILLCLILTLCACGEEKTNTSKESNSETDTEETKIELEVTDSENITVGIDDLSNYVIKFNINNGSETAKTNLSFAYDLKNAVEARTGLKLKDKAVVAEDGKYLTVDTSSLEYSKGEIRNDDGNITLYGSYHSIENVINYFAENMLFGNGAAFSDGVTELDFEDTPRIYSKDDLMKALEYSFENNDVLIVGDEVNGNKQMPSVWLDIYKNGCDDPARTGTGTYPSILGMDLGRCGMALGYIKDDEWGYVSQMVCEAIDYAADGGILTLGSHFRNPNYEDNAFTADINQSDRGTLGSEEKWEELVTPGTLLNTNFMRELENNADVLEAFDKAGVPIIWRPFHEVDGAWFWWGPKVGETFLDPELFIELWKYVYNYLTVERELDNLIWHYSPSTSARCLDYYPGDEYCDIVGIDWYTGGMLEILEDHMPYEMLMNTGKIVNLAEIGISDALKGDDLEEQNDIFNADSYKGIIIELYREDYGIGYFMTYNHIHSLAYLPGGEEFMKSDMVLDLSEMPDFWKKVCGFEIEK